MALFYDLFTLALLLVFFLVGLHRGFLKSVLSLASFLLAMLLAFLAAAEFAEPVYNNLFKDKVTSFIEENIDKVDVTELVNDYLLSNVGITADDSTVKSIIGTEGEIEDNIKSFAEQKGITVDEEAISQNVTSFLQSENLKSAITDALPSDMATAVFEAAQNSADAVERVLQACVDPDKSEAAEIIEDAFVNELLILAIKCVLFFIVFVVLRFIFKLIIAATGVINKIPVAGGINRTLGGVFGLVKGCAAMLLVAVIAAALVSVLGTKYSLFSESTINNSIIFKYIYAFVT